MEWELATKREDAQPQQSSMRIPKLVKSFAKRCDKAMKDPTRLLPYLEAKIGRMKAAKQTRELKCLTDTFISLKGTLEAGGSDKEEIRRLRRSIKESKRGAQLLLGPVSADEELEREYGFDLFLEKNGFYDRLTSKKK